MRAAREAASIWAAFGGALVVIPGPRHFVIMGNLPTVWMRSIRFHTYQGRPQDEGEVYLAHADMVETIESVLKFAVRDIPPKRLTRDRPLPEPPE